MFKRTERSGTLTRLKELDKSVLLGNLRTFWCKFMQAIEKNFQKNANDLRMFEDVIGCKWSLSVIDLIRNGILRPGAMEREIPGLTRKVLNERLQKLIRYGIIEKQVFPVSPPKVEYSLTAFGYKFVTILDEIAKLEGEIRK